MLLTALAALALQATPAQVAGTWDVSLFFSADAPPSSTVMVLSPQPDGTLDGSFYSSPFEEGRVAQRDGDTAFIATTRDGSGIYITSGRLVGPDVIEGQTLSTGRDFLMLWRAERRGGGSAP
jgi:hypothetical protein